MSQSARLDRREIVKRLIRERRDLLVVSGLGAATYDLGAAGDHDRNFYLWGAMGGACCVGLGLALAQPDVPVLVLTGDGEALMGMGAFATIALQKPRNLSVVILDNGLYGETGSQVSHTAGPTDLARVASACGIEETQVVEREADIERLAGRINTIGAGPMVVVVKIDGEEKPRCLPSRDGVMLKARLRRALGFASM